MTKKREQLFVERRGEGDYAVRGAIQPCGE